jgi:transposase-like protein
MAERYSDEVRGKARDLWLQGKTDEEIAAALGITRPDTIRDWRRKEDWTGIRRVIERGVSLRFDAERNVATADAKSREIRMVDAMESLIARQLRQVGSSQDVRTASNSLRSLTGALANIQLVRRRALEQDCDHGKPERRLTIAGLVDSMDLEEAHERSIDNLGIKALGPSPAA